MIGHEAAMSRARDYVVAQRITSDPPPPPGERRERYDVVAHLLRLQESCNSERAVLADERALNHDMREAVAKLGARAKWILAAFVAVFTLMVGIAAYFIARNREAIEVSCLVVVRVVRDSGANSGKPRTTRVGKAQARITSAFYAELLAGMTPERRAAVLRDQAIVRAAGGAIPEPRCADVAKDPGKVRREVLQNPRR